MTAGSSAEREPSLATLPISCSAGGLHVRYAEVCTRDVGCSSFACSHVAGTFLGPYDRKMGLGVSGTSLQSGSVEVGSDSVALLALTKTDIRERETLLNFSSFPVSGI